MYNKEGNVYKIYNIILESGIFPKEIVDIIFNIIYQKGCIILENGKIIDYSKVYNYRLALFVFFPENCNHFYANNYGKSPFPNIINLKLNTNTFSLCNNLFHSCYKLTKIDLNNSIIDLKDKVFYNCLNLKEIKLPKQIQCIGSECFKNCINLQKIEFPEGLKYLCKGAFEDCINLTKIILPKTIRYIGVYCFYNCKNVKSIEIKNKLFYINDPYYLKKKGLCPIYEASLWLQSTKLKEISIITSRKDLGKNWNIIFPHYTKYWKETINDKQYIYSEI